MPFYDFKCEHCDTKEIDIFLSISKKDNYTCSICGNKMKTIITSTFFELKGDGWFKDLYTKNKGTKNETTKSSTSTTTS